MPIPLDLGQLEEGIRGDASLQSFKTVDDLAKSHINAQKLIGTNRLPAPDKNWKPEQWESFYNSIGRPEKADGYKLPADLRLPEGISIDENKQKALFSEVHKLGLLPHQVDGVMKLYAGSLTEAHSTQKTMKEQTLASGMEALTKQHGDKLPAVIELANNTLTQLGNENLTNFLKENGLANHPEMVNFLYNIANKVSEDSSRGGGTPAPVGGAGAAMQEIKRLEGDAEFQKAYNDRGHSGHNAAVDRMVYLNRISIPGKVT